MCVCVCIHLGAHGLMPLKDVTTLCLLRACRHPPSGRSRAQMKIWTRTEKLTSHTRQRAWAVTQSSVHCGRPTCPHLGELIQVVHLRGAGLKCSLALIKPENEQRGIKELCAPRLEGVNVCVCVLCITHSVCAGRGLEIPYWRWLLS